VGWGIRTRAGLYGNRVWGVGRGVRAEVRPRLLGRVLCGRDQFGASGAWQRMWVPFGYSEFSYPCFQVVRTHASALPGPASFESLWMQKYLLDFILLGFAAELHGDRGKDNKEL